MLVRMCTQVRLEPPLAQGRESAALDLRAGAHARRLQHWVVREKPFRPCGPVSPRPRHGLSGRVHQPHFATHWDGRRQRWQRQWQQQQQQ